MKYNLLLVEDSDTWVELFFHLVGDNINNLFNIQIVQSLSSALNQLNSNQFDLILLDLLLPDSGASNTIKLMAEKVNKTTPIIIVTTLMDEKMMEIAKQHGIEHYLIKDQYDTETFYRIANEAVENLKTSKDKALNELQKLQQKLSSIDNALKKAQNEITNMVEETTEIISETLETEN